MAEKDLVWSNMASFRYFVSQTCMRIIACHVAYLECNLYTSSCAKEKIFKDWNYSERKSFLKICNKWARIWSNVVQKLKPKAIQKVAWRKIAQGDDYMNFGGKIQGNPFWILWRKCCQGKLCANSTKFSRQKS